MYTTGTKGVGAVAGTATVMSGPAALAYTGGNWVVGLAVSVSVVLLGLLLLFGVFVWSRRVARRRAVES